MCIRDRTSTLEVDYKGEKVNLSMVRNLAYDESAEVRKAAYEAELAGYEKIKEPVAFALNNICLLYTSQPPLNVFASMKSLS